MTDAIKTETAQPVNPFHAAPNSKKLMAVIAVYLGVMANLLVSTTNSTCLPAAAQEIGGMDIYGLAQGISGVLSVCVMPIFGFISARNPHLKRPLAAGSLLIGAIVLAVRVVAVNMWMILVANIFWGFVSGAVFAVGFTIIRDVYDRKQAGVYLGLVSTFMAIAQLAGPALGGAVIDNIGWRVWSAILCAFLVVACIAMWMSVKVTKEQAAPFASKGGKFDFVGAVIIVVFLGALIVVLSLGSSFVPFGSSLSNTLLIVAAVALAAFIIWIAKKKNDCIIPLNALKDRNVLVLSASYFFHNFGSMSITFFLAGFIMTNCANDPICLAIGPALTAGIASALMAVLGLFMGPVFGKMIAKAGTAKNVMIIGNVARVLVMAAFVLVLVPGVPVWLIWVIMFIAGVFNCQQTATQSAGPQLCLTEQIRATGNSTAQMFSNLGAGIGMAVFTLLTAMDPINGMRNCFIVTLVIWIVNFFVPFFMKKLNPEEEN